MNPETSIVCLDCGVTYTMADKEYQRFKELAVTIQNFKMPRRCSDCRRVRRNQAPVQSAPPQVLRPAVVAPIHSNSPALAPLKEVPSSAAPYFPPAPAPVAEAVPEKPKEEILFVLATKDFEELVNGQPIVWRGVKLVLADIGFKVMKKAIEDAELERAKKLVRANGH